MASRVARPHFDNNSIEKLSLNPNRHYQHVDNRHHVSRKSFLHGSQTQSHISTREHLSSLVEEEYDSGNSNTPWNYLVSQRSLSPTTSIRSGNSSPSEVNDSGVCSDHDTPPPRIRNRHHMLSSDSDNESILSSDSTQDFNSRYPEEIPENVYKPNKNKFHCKDKRKVIRNLIPPKLRLPESLLREICEKSKLMKKRRQQTWRDSGGFEGAIPPSAEGRHLSSRNSSYNRNGLGSRRNSYSNLHSIEHPNHSLAASSKFSSTSSLFNYDEYPDNSYYNFTESNAQSLYECVDKAAGVGFAGLKDIYSLQKQESTIRSCKGTIRGVKNRVRAGIATFMTGHHNMKFTEQEKGRLVVYLTTLGVVRQTHERCLRIRKILWTQLASFEERDVFLSIDTQTELMDRLDLPTVTLPHVFIEGQYLGDAERIELLNETGELKKLLQPYKKCGSQLSCENCGGYKFLPCSVCRGSKKSVHRNHFTLEFIALKCSYCDESGLIRCPECEAKSILE